MIEYTPLINDQLGVIKIPNTKLKFVFGMYPMKALDQTLSLGGYTKTISFKKYEFSDSPLWTVVTSSYPLGHPKCNVLSTTQNTITLWGDVNVSGAYLAWGVLGVDKIL